VRRREKWTYSDIIEVYAEVLGFELKLMVLGFLLGSGRVEFFEFIKDFLQSASHLFAIFVIKGS
jgi:hypothetical protein